MRRSTTAVLGHAAPTDLPEDAPGRVEVIVGVDPILPEHAEPVVAATPSASEATTPAAVRNGWIAVGLLAIAVVVVFVVLLALTH